MKDFPIVQELHYLDNAATTQRPLQLVEAMKDYTLKFNANAHRGIYSIGEKSTEIVEDTRKKVANWINASPEEIVFTKGTTEAINIVARGLKKSKIYLTQLEHHANFVPWQQFHEVIIANYDENTDKVNFDFEKEFDVLATTYMSNVTGSILPVKELIRKAKEKRALALVDAAQVIGHKKIDVKDLGCDFLAFSAHKMYGPTGVGVLYIKKEVQELVKPLIYGGNMIKNVTLEKTELAQGIQRFEAGTMDIAGIAGFNAALDYLAQNIENFSLNEEKLTCYLLEKLDEQKIKYFGHKNSSGPVVSFVLDVHPHDVSTILDRYNVCIRAGHHCAQPLMQCLGVVATCRVSFAGYNTKEDVDKLIQGLKEARRVING